MTLRIPYPRLSARSHSIRSVPWPNLSSKRISTLTPSYAILSLLTDLVKSSISVCLNALPRLSVGHTQFTRSQPFKWSTPPSRSTSKTKSSPFSRRPGSLVSRLLLTLLWVVGLSQDNIDPLTISTTTISESPFPGNFFAVLCIAGRLTNTQIQ